MSDKLNTVREIAESIFANSTQKKYWEHTKRVFAYAKTLGNAEKANMDIVLPAVLLHDVGMTVDASFVGHVVKSKLLARGILKDIGYNETDIEFIVKVIGSHHPVPGIMLDTLEEKILYDADNMEIIGVFGTLRWIGTFPTTPKELESSVDLFLSIVNKCVEARGSLFYTESAKKLGDKTVQSTVAYHSKLKEHIKQFESEIDNPFPVGF